MRDLLLGHRRSDLDLVVVGDTAALTEAVGALSLVEHDRFGTAKVELDGHEIDIAAARTETYSHPGELPTIWPAEDIETDLARRDFTINAMSIPLGTKPRLIDPYDGQADLEAGLLRVLHPKSFVDDPTRAIRAARYAARLGFEPEPQTAALLRATDLASVSGDRRWNELRPPGRPKRPGRRASELLAEWGLIEPREGGLELAGAVSALLGSEPWRGEVYRARGDPQRRPRPGRRRGRAGRRAPAPALARRSSWPAAATRSSWSSPAPSAPNGSTTTSRAGAGCGWRSTAPT